MPKIVLDAEAFKVLASDTRLSILKRLDERPMTVSELARDLTLNKATVFEHLASLTQGDLVKKKEREGRKWVYYTLTWKGKTLLHPENATVMVLLGLATLGSGAAMMQLGHYLRWWGIGLLTTDRESGDAGADAPESMPSPAGDTAGAQQAEAADDQERMLKAPEEPAADTDKAGPWDFLESSEFWMFGFLFLLASALFTAAYIVKARARGRPTAMSQALDEAEVRRKG